MLCSPSFVRLHRAAVRGVFAEAQVGRRRIVFEPGFPPNRRGMTLVGERGFLLGPRAFDSHQELVRTILQELYRLDRTEAGRPVDAGEASRRTRAAQGFVEEAWRLGRLTGLL